MAFDRYLAMCRPLHYTRLMTRQLCTGLVVFGWSCGFTLFLNPVVLISQLPYCGPNTIKHFVCDPVPLMMLSCSDDTTHTVHLLDLQFCFHDRHLPLYPLLLTSGDSGCAIDALSSGKMEGFLQLCFSSGHGDPGFWLCYGDVR